MKNYILYLVTKCEDVGDSKLDWVQYREKCYYASPSNGLEYLTWQSAESFCKENGGFLVSIHSLNELRFILSRVCDLNSCFIYHSFLLLIINLSFKNYTTWHFGLVYIKFLSRMDSFGQTVLP